MPFNPWDPYVPYSSEDVAAFLADGLDPVVLQRVRLERDRQAAYTADLFLYHRGQRRRMVWQFVAVSAASGQVRIEFPTPFVAAGTGALNRLGEALVAVIAQVERNPSLAGQGIVAADLAVPSDVPVLAGAGENRVAPGFAWNELYIHSAKRYRFAAERVAGMRVLDLGCGSGYGSRILAQAAAHVAAADADPEPLTWGRETYPHARIARIRIPYITREQGLPFPNQAFDAVVCFEVVEHVPVEQMEAWFAEIARVLHPDGHVVLSTPNKHIYIHHPDPHHVALMTLEDFRSLLESRFEHVQVHGQVRSRSLAATWGEFEIVPTATGGDKIFVAACRGWRGHTRPIAVPPPTVWPTEQPAHGSSIPGWWPRVWQRLRRGESAPAVAVGLPEPLVPEGFGLHTGPAAEPCGGLVACGDGWEAAAERLGDGAPFLLFAPADAPAERFREHVEARMNASAHLLDPAPDCPWIAAFGWRSQSIPHPRRRVLMATHLRALDLFGGGETQLFETLIALRDEGVQADVSLSLRLDPSAYELIHVFSLFNAEKAPRLEATNRPVAVSTILWDYQEMRHAAAVARAVFSQESQAEVLAALDAWREGRLAVNGLSPAACAEPAELRGAQRSVLEQAHILLPNGEREAEMVRRAFGAGHAPVRVVPNAVDAERILAAEPRAFVERFGLSDFVLCAARLEPNKNQLMLLWALRDLALPLVLAGKETDPEYAALCRRWAGPRVHLLGELPPDLLASAYRAARVHALPSWSETPGLANLEAAAAGCALVVGNRGTEQEYLDGHAHVCDPGDWRSIRAAVLAAWDDQDSARREARRAHVLDRFTWRAAARETAAAYAEILQPPSVRFAAPDWERADSWQPPILDHLRSGRGSLHLYAGPITRSTPERAYALAAGLLEREGASPEDCPDMEIVDVVPQHPRIVVLLTGGPLDDALRARHGMRCVQAAGRPAAA